MTCSHPPHSDAANPADDWRARPLDRYLDGIGQSGTRPPPALDAGLSAVARLTHDIGAVPVATVRATRTSRTWAALMDPSLRPTVIAGASSLRTVRLAPDMHALAEKTSLRAGSGNEHRPGNDVGVAGPTPLRRAGSRMLGMVATLTLVLLVGLSGVAVWLTAPRPEPTTTALYGGAREWSPPATRHPPPATPATTPLPWSDSIIPSPVPVAADDVMLLDTGTCDVAPRDRDEVLTLIEPYLSGRLERPASALDPVPAWFVPATIGAPDPPLEIPVGERPDAENVDAIAAVWSTWQGCQRYFEARRSATLLTNDGIVRYYLNDAANERYHPEPVISDRELLDWGPRPAAEMPDVEGPSDRALVGLRMVDNDHAVAILSGLELYRPPSTTTSGVGYVVFEPQGETWLIDDMPSTNLSLPAG